MYMIRPYEKKDRKRVEAICLPPKAVKEDGEGDKGGMLSKILLTVFCRYYVEQEPQNCFVAVDKRMKLQGISCVRQIFRCGKKILQVYI